jgi:hypothetical protein
MQIELMDAVGVDFERRAKGDLLALVIPTGPTVGRGVKANLEGSPPQASM